MKFQKICVIGLGYIGLPTATTFAAHGIDVLGVDINPQIIENLPNFIFKGPAMSRGMPDFTGKLSNDDVEAIKAFIQGTADAIRPK